jgi:hypothetical protein
VRSRSYIAADLFPTDDFSGICLAYSALKSLFKPRDLQQLGRGLGGLAVLEIG